MQLYGHDSQQRDIQVRTRGKPTRPILISTLIVPLLMQAMAVYADSPVAGVKPDSRPAEAPAITEFDRPDGWYDEALSGVEEPYPYSLRFLENQEAWYSPFSRAGMLPPYDIRGWHGK